MRAVVVVADPDPAGFTHVLATDAAAALRGAGHEVRRFDLCAEGFRAAMSAAEKQAYDTPEPVVDPMVAEHAAAVRGAEVLVVVYPTVMAGPPAVLKGWFERVMVPGLAFVFDHKHRVRPGLRTMRHLIGISTYRDGVWRVRLHNDVGRRLVTRTLRTSTGFSAKAEWLALYCADTVGDEGRARFRRRVAEAVSVL
jgi:putative NADPH-quinone reductase